jgi:hypothetical protein
MKLPLNIAEKLLLLVQENKIAASKLRHPIVLELIAEGIIHKPGKIKSLLQIADKQQLQLYLKNHFSITDLQAYIETLKKENLLRADLVLVATDSKLKALRTFKGFLVNCYSPVPATLNKEPIVIHPKEGTFNFVYDFEGFVPSPNVTIVGIENPENFRHIGKQQYLFAGIVPLFVSRYPQNQSKDLMKWLLSIPNNYLHFGDFDFAGIGIFFNEFKKYLGNKATFYTPDNIDDLIKNAGSKKRYDEQKINFDHNNVTEENLLNLIDSLHRHKKGLDQEMLINEYTPPTKIQ